MIIYNVVKSEYHSEEEGNHQYFSFYKKEDAILKYNELFKEVEAEVKELDTFHVVETDSFKSCHYINDNNDEIIISLEGTEVKTDIFYQLTIGDVKNTIEECLNEDEQIKMQQFSDEQILDVLSRKMEIDYQHYICEVLKARFLYE